MNTRALYLLVAIASVGTGLCKTAYATSADAQAFHQEAKAAREQAKAYAQAKRTEIQGLKQQIQTLKAQAKSTNDPATKQQLHAQIKGLRRQMCELMDDLAAHRVTWSQQGVAFAQRRLELARAHLAERQAREAQMETQR